MSVSGDDVAHWQQWVGKTENITERIDSAVLRRYAAALGESFDNEKHLPSLAHWAFFLSAEQPDNLGPDGHPKRGGFLPPITLPRRMFAASDIQFHTPLAIDHDATRSSQVTSLKHKSGKSGELILVEVEHIIEQTGRLAISEKQIIVYRETGEATPAVPDLGIAPRDDEIIWLPGPVDLFRFSAVTYNSHRIHYDLPYTQEEEGYPDLVVHGPFTAARLFHFADTRSAPLKRFNFRAQAPMFAKQPVRLSLGEEKNQVLAKRCDGQTSMIATFEI